MASGGKVAALRAGSDSPPAGRTKELRLFARHWGVRARACAPYRARTKGKTENGVGYVKKNAIAGRAFATWDAFEAHLEAWCREVADARIHGTTGESPIARFDRDEAGALKPAAGVPPFRAARDLIRVVQGDCSVEVDANAYSVPSGGRAGARYRYGRDGACVPWWPGGRRSSGLQRAPAAHRRTLALRGSGRRKAPDLCRRCRAAAIAARRFATAARRV